MSKDLLVKNCGNNRLNIDAPKLKGDVGYDLVIAEDTNVQPMSSVMGSPPVSVPHEVAVKVPENYFGLIMTRSSANKRGLIVQQGIIDSGYTGPLYSIVYNSTQKIIFLKKGEKIAQLILLPAHTPPMVELNELPDTERGHKGFGSTNN